MILSLMETITEMIKPHRASGGVIERGHNQNYEYEIWSGIHGRGYYLKVRSLNTKIIFDAPKVIGSFQSAQDAIEYFQQEYI